MPEVDEAIGWDFLTAVDWWNLYGLPVLLLAVAIAVFSRNRSRETNLGHDSARAVRLIGLIHCALVFQAMTALAQEVLALRVMGIPQSFVSPVGAVFSLLANSLLAIGVLRRRRWARWLAMAWYIFLCLLAILVVTWLFYYRVAVYLPDWSEQLASKVMPFFLFGVMLVPRIKRVFARRVRGEPLSVEPSDREGASTNPEAPAAWRVLSLLTLFFLIVVCSNVVVNAVDWGRRLMFESDTLP